MENVEKKSKLGLVGIVLACIIATVILAGAIITIITSLNGGKELKYGTQKAKVTPQENFSVKISDDFTTILSFNSEASTVAIPKKIGKEKVKVIGKEAFMENSSIHKVLIPDGVVTIEDKAFYYCMNLQYVYVPDSVTEIGLNSFMGNGDNFTVYGEENSYAQEFCEKHSIQFKVDK